MSRAITNIVPAGQQSLEALAGSAGAREGQSRTLLQQQAGSRQAQATQGQVQGQAAATATSAVNARAANASRERMATEGEQGALMRQFLQGQQEIAALEKLGQSRANMAIKIADYNRQADVVDRLLLGMAGFDEKERVLLENYGEESPGLPPGAPEELLGETTFQNPAAQALYESMQVLKGMEIGLGEDARIGNLRMMSRMMDVNDRSARLIGAKSIELASKNLQGYIGASRKREATDGMSNYLLGVAFEGLAGGGSLAPFEVFRGIGGPELQGIFQEFIRNDKISAEKRDEMMKILGDPKVSPEDIGVARDLARALRGRPGIDMEGFLTQFGGKPGVTPEDVSRVRSTLGRLEGFLSVVLKNHPQAAGNQAALDWGAFYEAGIAAGDSQEVAARKATQFSRDAGEVPFQVLDAASRGEPGAVKLLANETARMERQRGMSPAGKAALNVQVGDIFRTAAPPPSPTTQPTEPDKTIEESAFETGRKTLPAIGGFLQRRRDEFGRGLTKIEEFGRGLGQGGTPAERASVKKNEEIEASRKAGARGDIEGMIQSTKNVVVESGKTVGQLTRLVLMRMENGEISAQEAFTRVSELVRKASGDLPGQSGLPGRDLRAITTQPTTKPTTINEKLRQKSLRARGAELRDLEKKFREMRAAGVDLPDKAKRLLFEGTQAARIGDLEKAIRLKKQAIKIMEEAK